MVMDMIQSLGAQGKEAFIWWVLLDKALPAIVWLLSLSIFVWATFRIVVMCAEPAKAMRDLRDELRIGSTGYLTSGEIHQTLSRLQTLIRNSKA